MGSDDNLTASLAHVVLVCAAGHGASSHAQNYTHPGMHANFVIHGVIGFLHYQSGTFNNDFGAPYKFTLLASRYLALPCLMADLWKSRNQAVSVAHLLSGIVPFVIAVAQKEDVNLGHLCLTCNAISLIYYAFDSNREWGWYTAAAAIFSYFMVGQMGQPKIMYPLGLALMDYCACRLLGQNMGGSGGPRPAVRPGQGPARR